MLQRTTWLMAGSALALIWGATPALAADAAASSAATAGPVTTTQEVVVTARRKEESLQKVPEAVQVFSQQMLTDKSIHDEYSLDRAVSGLNVSSDSGSAARPTFAIRGRGLNYGSAAGSVETYFNDIPLSPPYQMPTFAPQFFDLQSMQVLKGPQGTLFGRSTTGGAILFVPQAPTYVFDGYARVQTGDFGDFQTEAAVNLPIIDDKVALRLSTFDWTRKGYGTTVAGNTDPFGNVLPTQHYGNEDIHQYRASLLLQPTDNLTNTMVFAVNIDNEKNTPRWTSGSVGSTYYPIVTKLGPRTADIDVNLSHPNNFAALFTNTTVYDINSHLLVKNIFGYVDSNGITNTGDDADGTPGPFIDLVSPTRKAKNQQYTDELQLQGHNFNDRLTWIVGGMLDQTVEPGGANANVFTIPISAGAAGVTYDISWQQAQARNNAFFGSATYKITDTISFTAGERHTWYRIDSKSANWSENNDPATFLATHENPVTAFSLEPGAMSSYNATTGSLFGNSDVNVQGDTYNFGLEDQLTRNNLLYAGYRRGFKPGGVNTRVPAGTPGTFNPESDGDYYLGSKNEFRVAGMPARFNIEGYWDFYHGLQTSYLTLQSLTSQVLDTVTTNIPATTFRGIDVDFSIDPTTWLRVSGVYAYLDAYNTNWTDHSADAFALAFSQPSWTGLSLKNNPVGFVSPNKASVTFRFHHDLPDNLGEIAFAPTVSYQDGWYATSFAKQLPAGSALIFTGFSSPYYSQVAHGGDFIPAYTLVDLHAEWNHIMGSRVSAAANLTNATNKVYRVGDTGTVQYGFEGSSYGAPRMFSIELSTKF